MDRYQNSMLPAALGPSRSSRFHGGNTRYPQRPPTGGPLMASYSASPPPEITVWIRGLRPGTTTLDIWHNFRRHGQVVVVEIHDERRAKVRFSPAPRRPFWEDVNYHFTTEDRTMSYKVMLQLDESRYRRKFEIRSPIRKGVWLPERIKFAPSKISFGFMLDRRTVMRMKDVVPQGPRPMSFQADFLRRRLLLQFELRIEDPRDPPQASEDAPPPNVPSEIGNLNRILEYQIEFKFEHIKELRRSQLGDGGFALSVSLDDPPRVFRRLEDVKASHESNKTRAAGVAAKYDGLFWHDSDLWIRQTDIVYNPDDLSHSALAINKDPPVIDIGRWTTYTLEFQSTSATSADFDLFKSALRDFNIEIRDTDLDSMIYVPRETPEFWSIIDPPSILQHSTTKGLSTLAFTESAFHLPFEVRYQLEVCISQDILNEYNIATEFVARLLDMDMVKARYLLEYIADKNERIYEPMTIFSDTEATRYIPRAQVPRYCAYSRKATITPSKIIFSTPIIETTNRVLRHFSREHDDGRFLRVQFTDEESEGKIHSCAGKALQNEVYTRVFRVLQNGIRIGDRHYQFLAFGNSQFREHGAYFFCESAALTCVDIRKWMGNFTHIKVIAKYAARLGQCFSTTRAINGLSNPKIVMLEDVKRNGYTFTDGVGKISPFLAKMIAAELGLNVERPPSAFQIRLGGCKGLLVVWDDARLNEVHVRRSQEKFTAVYNGLEIIKCAQYSSAKLNRQTITILSCLGVKDQVFLDMMAHELRDYKAALTDGELAVRMLSRNIDENQMTINIATMVLNGFMNSYEPFVMTLLHLWRTWSIKLLKEKARINIEQSAFVFGCVDETATLRGFTKPKPGADTSSIDVSELPQVFLQVPVLKDDQSRYMIIEGLCLVGRNPSLHPGDLRVVQAVNVPALHHLRDLLVFPQNGDQDVPSMCSGGDLDGDDYFVIWDANLQPREWNHTPMVQKQAPQKTLSRQVQALDLIKFQVKFMKNDDLARIAHAHLAQADFRQAGVKDPICLKLAALHSDAVDYSKTGQPAEYTKDLIPPKWPHFMEKRHMAKDASYHSDKVLGKLYDSVESVEFTPQWKSKFDRRILHAFKHDREQLRAARRIKSQYDIAMRRIMAQQSIDTEFEVWTTFVLSRPKIGNMYKQQEQMKYVTDDLKGTFRAACVEQAGSRDYDKLAPFVAAMYKVTSEEMRIALAECRATKMVRGKVVAKRPMRQKYMPLISFPWLFEKELGRIATGVEHSLDDIGLPTYKLRSSATGLVGPMEDEDDFVETRDGKIIHRGEELDLFRSQSDQGSDVETDDEEPDSITARSDDGSEIVTDTENDVDQPGQSGSSIASHLDTPVTDMGSDLSDIIPTPSGIATIREALSVMGVFDQGSNDSDAYSNPGQQKQDSQMQKDSASEDAHVDVKAATDSRTVEETSPAETHMEEVEVEEEMEPEVEVEHEGPLGITSADRLQSFLDQDSDDDKSEDDDILESLNEGQQNAMIGA